MCPSFIHSYIENSSEVNPPTFRARISLIECMCPSFIHSYIENSSEVNPTFRARISLIECMCPSWFAWRISPQRRRQCLDKFNESRFTRKIVTCVYIALIYKLKAKQRKCIRCWNWVRLKHISYQIYKHYIYTYMQVNILCYL